MNTLRTGVPLLLLLCAATLSANAHAKGKKVSVDCMQTATTQFALDQCAGDRDQKARDKLKNIDDKILKEYAGDPVFIKAFKASQKAWIAYKAAQIKMMFPHADERMYYGSVFPMCEAQYEETLIRARIAQLMLWIKGTPEGDSCAGSVKIVPLAADAKSSSQASRSPAGAAPCFAAASL